MDIDIEGMADIKQALADKSGAIAEALEAVVEETARSVQSEARSLVPVDTGQLRDSISATTNGLEGEVFVSQDAPHGIYVEFGTSSRPEQPFMGPAGQLEAGRMEKRVAEAVKKAAG